ncbi:MAG TPA: hemolysin III family protein, partial [Aggregatilineales bacterium]|nr:hemolysin III family protein [Aggregatilineales bacterium]
MSLYSQILSLARSHSREPVSGYTHLAAAILALAGLFWMILLTDHDSSKRVTVIIFGVSMVLVYVSSAMLHLFDGSLQVL